jgi:LmbE family N-acetylglucosaminyl deacetylase
MVKEPDDPQGVTLVVSPHLDDAVFSCGEWMATHPGAQVVTVFAGAPLDTTVTTEWDAACGFVNARQALQLRRLEDRQALDVLGAKPTWLEHADDQYGQARDAGQITATLVPLLQGIGPVRLLLPMGLYHRDHLLAHEATLHALAAWGRSVEVWAYEDVPYRRRAGLLQNRLCELRQAGIVATPVPDCEAPPGALKDRAVAAYVSQWRALGGEAREDTRRPEHFWSLELPAMAR